MSDIFRRELQASLGTTVILDRELGGGGMSRVFVARDETLAREIVVKVLAPELIEGLSVERFAREIKLAAGLQEPHIVPVLSAGTTASGLPYYTMPLVEGKSLRTQMAEGSVLESDALSILRDVARALAYAHARHIVHRDIKPENILLSSGTAVVTDFGIAKALEVSRTQPTGVGAARGALTQTGTSLGTPAYMAPEQAAGDPATDSRADIYAWGVVAYELLSGTHPFASKTTPQLLMAAHFGEMPAELRTTGGGVSGDVRALVMRCLAKDAGDRPASAGELVRVLSGMASDVRAARVPAARSTRMVGVTVAAVMAIAVTLFVWKSRMPRNDARVVGAGTSDSTSTPLMMAVLPFEHAGPTDQQPFTDGLTDAVTAKLGALKSLAVIDRRSAAEYRGSKKSSQQIGEELGVKYLLEGVVRWARDGAGVLRARVTPTLIDASTGITKWTGEATAITLDDPFTAQGAVATDVAKALEVALLPGDRAKLARHMTDNPQALLAFQRGGALMDMAGRYSTSDADIRNQQAIVEFEKAVNLDRNFAESWGALALLKNNRAQGMLIKSAEEDGRRKTMTLARAYAPDDPMVLLSSAWERLDVDHDTTGVDALLARALRDSPSNAFVLTWAAGLLGVRQQIDSAYAVAKRAAVLDPRSLIVLQRAAELARSLHHWDEARNYANKMIALQPKEEVGWVERVATSLAQGDSTGVQRGLDSAAKFAPLGQLSMALFPYAPGYATAFANSGERNYRPRTIFDSVTYFQLRQDAFLRLGNASRARAYSDSMAAMLSGRFVTGYDAAWMLSELAFALSNSGHVTQAHEAMVHALDASRPYSPRKQPADWIEATTAAGTYARLGDVDTAIEWLEAGLKPTVFSYHITANSFAVHPRLNILRGNPKFEAFLRAHPE